MHGIAAAPLDPLRTEALTKACAAPLCWHSVEHCPLLNMRLFFDSRRRLPSSASSSDFTLQLNENIQLRPGAKVRLHDVSIPYSWRTVEANVNDHIYLQERPTAASDSLFRRLT